MYQERQPSHEGLEVLRSDRETPGRPGGDGAGGTRAAQGPAERAGRGGETAGLPLRHQLSRCFSPASRGCDVSLGDLGWGRAGEPLQLLQRDAGGGRVSWTRRKASLDTSKCAPRLLTAAWPPPLLKLINPRCSTLPASWRPRQPTPGASVWLQRLSSGRRRQPLTALVHQGITYMQETGVRSLGQEDPLEKGMATHSSTLAWRFPWTQQSLGSQRVDSTE